MTFLMLIRNCAIALGITLQCGTQAFANCEKPGEQSLGKAYLQRLAGGWHVTGISHGSPFLGNAAGNWVGSQLVLTFRSAQGTAVGLPSLTLSYEARCDEFVAVSRDSVDAGSGVMRADVLDITFHARNGADTDITFNWDGRRKEWNVNVNRLGAKKRWVTYTAVHLTR